MHKSIKMFLQNKRKGYQASGLEGTIKFRRAYQKEAIISIVKAHQSKLTTFAYIMDKCTDVDEMFSQEQL